MSDASAHSERLAVFEAGSNSLKLYLVQAGAGEEAIEVVKFPWSVAHVFFATGSISDQVVDEIVATFREAGAAAEGADLSSALALATGVFRELDDLEALLDRVRRDTGVRLRLITGADEARLMARGFRDLAIDPPAVLCDVGGATTEWVWLRPDAESVFGSLRLGAIRNHHTLPPASSLADYLAASDALCDHELDALPVEGEVTLVVAGGTAGALALIAGSNTIGADQLDEVLERVYRHGAPAELTQARRKVLLPGLAIVRRLLARFGARELRYEAAAVRSGMVRRLLTLLDEVPREELHATQLLRTTAGRHLLFPELLGAAELTPGATLGRYRVVDTLGRGGMGAVYRAHDPELGRDVALKVMHARAGAGDQLLSEAQSLAKISHPNVVTVHDVGRVDDDVFIAMELVEGVTLTQWRSAEPRTADEVLAVFLAAGRGLAATHEAGLVQRDFKPDNVIVGDDGRVRLVDFGLARADTTDGEHPAGTPAYMAPEQFRRDPIDERTDQFSYCVAFWEALYGQPPFRGDSFAERERSVVSGRVESPPDGAGSAPQWLDAAIRRGLSVDPAARYRSMNDLLADIDRSPPAGVSKRAVAIGAVAAVAIAIATGVFAARSTGTAAVEPDPCAGAAARLEGVWDRDVKRRVRQSFVATGRPHAPVTFDRVATVLDGYASAWVVMAADACESARVHGRESDAVFALRNQCLDERLEDLQRLATRFANEADAALVDSAVQHAFGLEPIEACSDVTALAEAARAREPAAADDGRCGVPSEGRYNPIEIGRAWVYDVIDPSTGLPRNKDPKVVTVEALGRIGGCKGDRTAYRVRRDTATGYAYRWVEEREVASPGGKRSGAITLRHRDQWFTNDGTPTKDEYFEPARVRLDESCRRTLKRASFVDVYDEIEVTPGEACGDEVDSRTKTYDWQVLGVDEQVELTLDYAHPACCGAAPPGECRPPPDGPGHTCRPAPGGRAGEWACTFATLHVARREVRGDKYAQYWFAPGVGKVKENSRGDELETLICFSTP